MEETQELITTGEAARLLGVSRQHIVDLCDRGLLACKRTPVHRRLRRSDVQALRKPGELTREEMRSLWLNRAVAARVAHDPATVLSRARQNLDRFELIHKGTPVATWLERWRGVLDSGPEAVMEVLTSTAPDASELRQNSPFPGVLPEDERLAVLDSFADFWRRSAA
ncbi:MAG: helix-turn-helix domain-containing protein [Chloroflexota bacterium]|nr:helix-turn-helix domain-containing protein [Chloroflexota bacterium]